MRPPGPSPSGSPCSLPPRRRGSVSMTPGPPPRTARRPFPSRTPRDIRPRHTSRRCTESCVVRPILFGEGTDPAEDPEVAPAGDADLDLDGLILPDSEGVDGLLGERDHERASHAARLRENGYHVI